MKMEELFVLIRKVMHFDLEESMLSDDFSSLGLSSLDRVNLLIEIEDHYHMVIDENNLPWPWRSAITRPVCRQMEALANESCSRRRFLRWRQGLPTNMACRAAV